MLTIRDTHPDDVASIWRLRTDPRLRGMQYRPSLGERPESIVAIANASVDWGSCGYQLTTIMLADQFAGYISQQFFTQQIREASGDGRHATRTTCMLGWNLIPELWGRGLMPLALKQLVDQRFQVVRPLQFQALCFTSNHRCVRVMDKVGFREVTAHWLIRYEHWLRTFGRQTVRMFVLGSDDD